MCLNSIFNNTKFFEYRKRFLSVEHIDRINRYNCSFKNSVLKLNVLLPLLTRALSKNQGDVINSATYKLQNITISRQPILLNTKNYY